MPWMQIRHELAETAETIENAEAAKEIQRRE
jgi:hypothetical protein